MLLCLLLSCLLLNNLCEWFATDVKSRLKISCIWKKIRLVGELVKKNSAKKQNQENWSSHTFFFRLHRLLHMPPIGKITVIVADKISFIFIYIFLEDTDSDLMGTKNPNHCSLINLTSFHLKVFLAHFLCLLLHTQGNRIVEKGQASLF